VKVRIVKRPSGTVDGMDLRRYVPGELYDVSPSLADYLVMEGFATFEMRAQKRVRLKKKRDRREK
jgi:hypothetical protein